MSTEDRRTAEEIAVPDDVSIETVIEGIAEALPGGKSGEGREEDADRPGEPRIDPETDQTPRSDEITHPG